MSVSKNKQRDFAGIHYEIIHTFSIGPIVTFVLNSCFFCGKYWCWKLWNGSYISKNSVLNVSCCMAKTIRITRRLSCVPFQVLALPEARGVPQPAAVVLDQTTGWKGIQWHLLQWSPDRLTFQGETYSYLQTTQIQSHLQTIISPFLCSSAAVNQYLTIKFTGCSGMYLLWPPFISHLHIFLD